MNYTYLCGVIYKEGKQRDGRRPFACYWFQINKERPRRHGCRFIWTTTPVYYNRTRGPALIELKSAFKNFNKFVNEKKNQKRETEKLC